MRVPKFCLSCSIPVARPINYFRNLLCVVLLIAILRECIVIWNDCAPPTNTSYAANSTLGVSRSIVIVEKPNTDQ